MMLLINGICKELNVENYKDLIAKVKELKTFQKKHSKERKLIINL